MSGESKEPNLQTSEVESIVQESSLNVTKKGKRNYCHVCAVQCTAAKNFEEHKKGRKHLKKLSEAKLSQRQIKKNTKKSKKAKQKNVKLQKSVNQTCTESHESNEMHETMMSHSNYYNSSKKRFNSDRDNSRNKHKVVSSHQTYQIRSNNHYNNYSNPYNYRNQSFYGNEHYSNYTGWNYGPFADPPLLNGTNSNGYLQNAGLYSQYGYNSQDFYSFSKNRPYNFKQSENQPSTSQEYDHNSTTRNKNSYAVQTYSETNAKNENSEKELQVENLDSKNSENTDNLSHNNTRGDISPDKLESPDVRQHGVNSNNCSNELSTSTSVADVVESNGSKQSSSPVPNISGSKKNEKRKVRSRSLSSSECSSNEKRIKDATENQSVDLDTVAKQQSIKDWANTLRETNPSQLSRLIHPSNYKDKAVVNQLITNLSKSKRKENLTKLKSNSLASNENFDEEESDIISEEIDKIVESVISVSDNISSNSQFEELPSTESNSDVEHNTESRLSVKKSKKSSVSKKAESNVDSISQDNCGKLKISKKSVRLVSFHGGIKISNQSDRKNKGKFSVSSDESATEKIKNPSDPEIPVKRKSLTNKSKRKRQRYSDAESSEKVSDDQNNVQADTANSVPASTPNIGKVTTNIVDSSSIVLPVKSENSETLVQDPIDSANGNAQTSQPPGLDFNCEFTADTLMQLFATGSVKVKKEFYDPVIDAIKSVDPNELINACSSKSSHSNANEAGSKASSLDSSVRIPKDKSAVSRSSASRGIINENNDMNPVILGSITMSDNIPVVSNVPNSSRSLSNSVSDSQSASSLNETDKNTTDSSLSYAKDMNLIPKDKSHLSPHLKKLIKDLQEIASQEETVKQNITEAKNKINEYQTLLDEWKNKKKKLHDEEEDLRKKRNDIIKLMQNAVKPSSETKNEIVMETSDLPVKKSNPVPVSDERQYQRSVYSSRNETSSNSSKSLKSARTHAGKNSQSPMQEKTDELPEIAESDEITVIPVPVKEPEIVVIDDAEDTKVVHVSSEDSDDIEGEIFTNVISSNVRSIFDMKELSGHSAVVNCIVVFEDFVYTCSNDNTAKRFNLKDPSQTVLYMHTAKNVTEIVVEKVQNEALVFTSCSNRVISLFIAASGTKIKTFFQTCAIMSICRGWGKFYSGLANGIINVYNWKYEEREFVKIEHPAVRIATAHQGRLHFLVILSSNGNISLRDAETGLLIRYIKGFVKLPSWLTVHNDLAYLSSSDKTLTILDIMTGRAEKKMYLSCNTTGLGVFEDFIFTISYSGILNCYSKEKVSDRKVFYGAGKSGLTCIHVHQNLVFTGNRKGDIAVFRFDPSCSMPCKFGNCSYTFGLKADLEYHLEKEHLLRKKNLTRCHWTMCCFAFPPNWNIEVKVFVCFNSSNDKNRVSA